MINRISFIINEKEAGKQVAFALKIGVSKGNVTNWLKGNGKPTWDALVQICIQYNVNINWLLTGEGDPFFKKEKPKSFSDIYKPREKKELRDPYKEAFIPELVAMAGYLSKSNRLKLFRIACILSEIGRYEINDSGDGGDDKPILKEK